MTPSGPTFSLSALSAKIQEHERISQPAAGLGQAGDAGSGSPVQGRGSSLTLSTQSIRRWALDCAFLGLTFVQWLFRIPGVLFSLAHTWLVLLHDAFNPSMVGSGAEL